MHVVLTGLDGYVASPGDTVAVDVGGSAMRRYTVAGAQSGSLEIVAVLTGLGPATPWLRSLVPGATVRGQGPERPVTAPVGARGVLVVGDETAIGTALSVARSVAAQGAGVPVRAVIRSSSPLPQACALLESNGCPHTTVASPDAVHDADLAAAVSEWGADGAAVVVVGEQSANHAVRTAALALGIARDRVATRTFWRPDRAGLE